MLLKFAEKLQLDSPPDGVWKLLRNTPRLAGLLPGVEDVKAIGGSGEEAYAARASEKIGPFKITLNLEVKITEAREASLLHASIKGADSIGLNRVTGSIRITLAPEGRGTKMDFEASVEVLGKLATLGAVPIRRRTTQSFAEFAQNIQRQFAQEHG